MPPAEEQQSLGAAQAAETTIPTAATPTPFVATDATPTPIVATAASPTPTVATPTVATPTVATVATVATPTTLTVANRVVAAGHPGGRPAHGTASRPRCPSRVVLRGAAYMASMGMVIRRFSSSSKKVF